MDHSAEVVSDILQFATGTVRLAAAAWPDFSWAVADTGHRSLLDRSLGRSHYWRNHYYRTRYCQSHFRIHLARMDRTAAAGMLEAEEVGYNSEPELALSQPDRYICALVLGRNSDRRPW